MHPAAEDVVLRRIVEWATARDSVRAVVLTSSRARGDATDEWSDYDVILYAADPHVLAADAGWLTAFGPVLVRFFTDLTEHGFDYAMRMVVLEDGTKIDFAVIGADALRRMAAERRLPPMLDVGYRVLVDKDDLAARLPAATGAAHVPRPPTQAELDGLVEEFWWESLYVAKHLLRDDLLPAKYSFDAVMKLDLLRRLLEWRIEIDRGWTWRPGDIGRGLKRHLDDDTWTELAATFTGAGTDENWVALFRTSTLFRRLAREVAARLSLSYPEALDARVTARLEAIRRSQR